MCWDIAPYLSQPGYPCTGLHWHITSPPCGLWAHVQGLARRERHLPSPALPCRLPLAGPRTALPHPTGSRRMGRRPQQGSQSQDELCRLPHPFPAPHLSCSSPFHFRPDFPRPAVLLCQGLRWCHPSCLVGMSSVGKAGSPLVLQGGRAIASSPPSFLSTFLPDSLSSHSPKARVGIAAPVAVRRGRSLKPIFPTYPTAE